MALETRIENELNRLASLSGAAGSSRLLRLAVEDGQLECGITAVDRLACSFERFSLHTDRLADATIDQLQRLAETLSERLSYLLEPISPVEVDQQRCVVQMRSRPPSRDDEGTSYYELVVRRGDISLCRYARSPGQTRRLTPATVTREVLQRLADDFVQSIA